MLHNRLRCVASVFPKQSVLTHIVKGMAVVHTACIPMPTDPDLHRTGLMPWDQADSYTCRHECVSFNEFH